MSFSDLGLKESLIRLHLKYSGESPQEDHPELDVEDMSQKESLTLGEKDSAVN